MYSGGIAEQEAVYTAARRAPGPLLTVVGKLAVTTNLRDVAILESTPAIEFESIPFGPAGER